MFESISLQAFFGGIGPVEMLIIGVVAVLLFGSRLPSVARSLGKSLVEFKKGMRDIEDDLKSSIYSEPTGRVTYRDPGDPPAEQPVPTAAAESESADESEPAAEVQSH